MWKEIRAVKEVLGLILANVR